MSPNSYCIPINGGDGTMVLEVRSLPTNGQNVTITVTATYQSATPISVDIILIGSKTP
jgi:hypothetical protein